MSDLPQSFIDYINKRGHNIYDKDIHKVRLRKPWTFKQYTESLESLEEDTIYDAAAESAQTSFGGGPTSVLSESTPLISSVPASTSISGSTIATGLLIGGATIGLGVTAGLASQNSEDHKKPIISLPDHNYAGPGNTIHKGAIPLDKDDHIALNHDKDYNKADSDSAVREADREFIHDNLQEAFKGNIHSAINTVGIGSKYALESLTGVIYKGT